jgi:hypothetical protein
MARIAHKVLAKDKSDKIVAEYIFATMAEANTFAEGCSKNGYKVIQIEFKMENEIEKEI